MKLPRLFLQIHQREINSCFHKYGPIFSIVPREPLGSVSLSDLGNTMGDATVTVVTIRCINDRGTLRVKAFSEADLAVANQWAEKHRDTPVEDFTWLPSSLAAVGT